MPQKKPKLRYITLLVAEETYQYVKKQAKTEKKTIASMVRSLLLAAINFSPKQ
jgi:hypothetical protein